MARRQEKTQPDPRKEKIRLNPSDSSTVTFLHKLAGYVGVGYLSFVAKTSIVRNWDHPAYLALRHEKKNGIFTFWHNKQVYLAYAHKGQRINVIVSRSKDGEYIAQVMHRLGQNAVRGSSSRGGEAALLEMVDLLKSGAHGGFTPDGPRGPVQTVHGGVVMAAQHSGAPIFPLTCVNSRKIVFRSWDKFQVPLPFGSILVRHGKPFTLPPEMPLEEAKNKVREALNRNEEEAEQAFKMFPGWASYYTGFFLHQLYSLLTVVLMPLIFVFMAVRYGGKRTAKFVGERISPRIPEVNGRRRFWLHSASIGEWQALKPVLARLKKISDFEFVVTVSTPEARALVAREEPGIIVRMAPADLPWVLGRAVKKIAPFAVGIVETELWPNMLAALKKRNIPVFLINGRLSQRSLGRWKVAKPLAGRLLESFAGIFVRTAVDGRRLVQLGAPVLRVRETGNTKVDNLTARVPSAENDGERNRKRIALFGNADGVLVTGASTWSGEEASLLNLFSEKLSVPFKLILAPRRLERCSEVTALLEKIPASWSLWSKVKTTNMWETDILLVDTLGDLKELIAVSDIGFVGGSLNPRGGQNPLEPAAAGIPVLFGPSMSNFHEEAAELKRAGAARQARNEKDLLMDIREFINDENLRRSAGQAAARFVESKQGASDRTASALAELLAL